jgi:hypothetical protein
MIVAEKLIEVGIQCPCGSRTEIAQINRDQCWRLVCINGCESLTKLYYSKMELLTAWFILTGGPVPGEIKPPILSYDLSISVILGGIVCYYDHRDNHWSIPYSNTKVDDHLCWYFVDRSKGIIRPWLESKIEDKK